MKITSPISSPAAPAKAHPQTMQASAAKVPVADDASVALHLQQTGGASAAVAPFDSQRVAEIRQAIADGRFQIDADKIAGRLIDGVRDLLGKDRPPA